MEKNREMFVKLNLEDIREKSTISVALFSTERSRVHETRIDLCDSCVFCFEGWWKGPKPRVD